MSQQYPKRDFSNAPLMHWLLKHERKHPITNHNAKKHRPLEELWPKWVEEVRKEIAARGE